MSDLLFKYKGWAYSAEYIKRVSGDHPATFNENGDVRHVYEGQGTNHQLSYMFPKKYEIAFRYSLLIPGNEIEAYQDRWDVLEIGATKYLRAHRIKAQWSVIYNAADGNFRTSNQKNYLGMMIQIELGI